MSDDEEPSLANELVEPSRKTRANLPLPSTNPATNLLILDVLLRGSGRLFRNKMQRRLIKEDYSDDDARLMVDDRSVLTSLTLYGASKLATKSLPGFALVTSGLLAKSLYDRGKMRQRRRRKRIKRG